MERFNIGTIIHRFPLPGHSFLPNDAAFGDIEKAKKKKDALYTVQQYSDMMVKSSKRTPVVYHMKTEDFKDFTKGMNFKNLSKPVDTDGNKFNWLHIHEFRYETGLFGFKFRYNLEEEYRTCKLRPKPTPRQPKPKPTFGEPAMLYPKGRKLAAAKVLDFMTLMKYVPEVYQDFYKEIIESHKVEVMKYQESKKKKAKKARDKIKRKKRNEDEEEDEDQDLDESEEDTSSDEEDDEEELM